MGNILVIGSNSSIAKEIITLLKQENHTIYTTSRSSEYISDYHLCTSLNEQDIDWSFFPEEINQLFYMPGSINLKPLKFLKEDDFKNDFEVNVLGFVRYIKNLEKNLKKGNASILSFTSVASSLGLDYHASVSTAKGALESLNKALAAEFIDSLRFNTIALSLSDTQMAQSLLNSDKKIELAKSRNPKGMIGDPKKIASFATFINSSACDWLTAENIHLDGGMSHLKLFK